MGINITLNGSMIVIGPYKGKDCLICINEQWCKLALGTQRTTEYLFVHSSNKFLQRFPRSFFIKKIKKTKQKKVKQFEITYQLFKNLR